MRIAKYLASCGLGSRRNCEELITAGRVSVNGQLIDSPALNVEPGADVILLDGNPVSPQTKAYYLLNKPIGFTCSLADEHAERLITELVPENIIVWPVGRLDRDTSGLIILTNDGDLTQRMTHPSFEKSKTYVATLDKPLASSELQELAKGVELDDGRIKPDAIVELDGTSYEITVHEGRNRLVRRIFEHFGRKVIALNRTKLSFLEAGSLKLGKYRHLTSTEITRLRNA